MKHDKHSVLTKSSWYEVRVVGFRVIGAQSSKQPQFLLLTPKYFASFLGMKCLSIQL